MFLRASMCCITNKPMRILVNTNYFRETFADFPAGVEVEFAQGKPFYGVREMEERIAPYDILVIPSLFPVSNSLLDRASNLKLICNLGAGFNNVDLAYARSKGILVCNTPDAVTQSTAELALNLMLTILRRTSEIDRRIRCEKETLWQYDKLTARCLAGRTLGIVGMGKIGRRVAELASVFGTRIVYHNPRTEVPGYERLEFNELLRVSDLVSLHVPLNQASFHLMGRAQFDRMKSDAVLINVSRGPVVDERALVEALQRKAIAGAALDVFENEPKVAEELYSMHNVVLTPHIGGNTFESLYAMMYDAAQNARAFIAGNPVHVVN